MPRCAKGLVKPLGLWQTLRASEQASGPYRKVTGLDGICHTTLQVLGQSGGVHRYVWCTGRPAPNQPFGLHEHDDFHVTCLECLAR